GGCPRHRRGRAQPPPGRQLRHLFRRAAGLGDDPFQPARRALGGRRALALAAAGPDAGRRQLRTEGALQLAARAADGRAALRRRRRDHRTGFAARAGTLAAGARAVQLRPVAAGGSQAVRRRRGMVRLTPPSVSEPAMQHTSSSPESRFLRQALAGAAFLGLVALASLPAARGAGPIGWMPLWLPGLPLVALAALALADLRERAREP